MARNKVAVLDTDSGRRNRMVRMLSQVAYACPLASFSELIELWPRDALLLIHDDEELVAKSSLAAREAGLWLPIVAYHEAADADRIISALKDGAMSYMDWPLTEADFHTRLAQFEEEATRKGEWAAISISSAKKIASLSPRERQIFEGVMEGYSSRRIASELQLSVRTVEIHRSNLLRKLGANNSAAAIRIGLEAELPWNQLKDIMR